MLMKGTMSKREKEKSLTNFSQGRNESLSLSYRGRWGVTHFQISSISFFLSFFLPPNEWGEGDPSFWKAARYHHRWEEGGLSISHAGAEQGTALRCTLLSGVSMRALSVLSSYQ